MLFFSAQKRLGPFLDFILKQNIFILFYFFRETLFILVTDLGGPSLELQSVPPAQSYSEQGSKQQNLSAEAAARQKEQKNQSAKRADANDATRQVTRKMRISRKRPCVASGNGISLQGYALNILHLSTCFEIKVLVAGSQNQDLSCYNLFFSFNYLTFILKTKL